MGRAPGNGGGAASGSKKCNCKAKFPGDRYHPQSRINAEGKREKICTYTCTCTDGCKTETFDITFSAGFGGSAECIGQDTVIPHYTQPGQIPSTTFNDFNFDSNSLTERINPFSPVPNNFIDKINNR
jgi:hypothetical protein